MKRMVFVKFGFSALLMFFAIGWATRYHSQSPQFVPAPSSPLTVGPGSGEIVLADLNRDGHLDLLTKHLLGKTMAVRLGDGHGHFALIAEGPMNFGFQPGAIALGDVNNDRILDLGVASWDADIEYLHIFLGNGRGTFSLVPGAPVKVGSSTRGYKPMIRFWDVNEDGNLDVVMANGRRNSIEILLGDGRGSFSPGPIVKLESGYSLYTFVLGDVDGDGHLDVVSASSAQAEGGPGRLEIKRGDGKGAFSDAPGSPFTVLPDPRLGTLADVNGDQHLDIVLSHFSNYLSVLLSRGNGSFTPATASRYNLSGQAFGIVAADVNGDKRIDLVAATVNSVTVLLRDESGFAPAPGSPFRAGPGAYNVAVGDINEDGRLDIAASSFEGNAVTLLLGR